MKQFNLEEYLKNSNKNVVTRNNKQVIILKVLNKAMKEPIIAWIKPSTDSKRGTLRFYRADGTSRGIRIFNRRYDLFFSPKTHEGWVNVGKGFTGDNFFTSMVFPTKEQAIIGRGKNTGDYVDTVKINWEVV